MRAKPWKGKTIQSHEFENGTRSSGRILTLSQPLPPQNPIYHAATLLSEDYKAAMIRWLTMLGRKLPGEVCYLGAGPVMCMAGETDSNGYVVVLDALDLDGDDAPELKFAKPPKKISRLQGDGTWTEVRFKKTGDDTYRLLSPIRVQQSAIFKYDN